MLTQVSSCNGFFGSESGGASQPDVDIYLDSRQTIQGGECIRVINILQGVSRGGDTSLKVLNVPTTKDDIVAELKKKNMYTSEHYQTPLAVSFLQGGQVEILNRNMKLFRIPFTHKNTIYEFFFASRKSLKTN
eukprot:GHVT01019232.1.p1 GENE.GHVT01019232.1~~GHVT01019232.1.p1  ORF type:complete len:133 (+),score=4.93 GHVT01019232.1:931-1329(+)